MIDTMNVSVSDDSVNSPLSLRSRISPWMMLPPAFEGGKMVYKFYSLAENKVVSVDKRGGGGGEEELKNLPVDEAVLVGSSHGWLALFNRSNLDLILSNPFSRRNVKLPPMHTLPALPETNLSCGWGCVSKVVISCSPLEDEENCRAMIAYGPANRLAFCWPGLSAAWTPIGAEFYDDDLKDRWGRRMGRVYESFVYSGRRKIFFSITQECEFEAWDLSDPESPKIIDPMVLSMDKKIYPWAAGLEEEEDLDLKVPIMSTKYLVISEQSDELFLVKRFFVDVYSSPNQEYDENVPYKTVGFCVYKHDPKDGALKYMDRSLGGLSMFIGENHSFAMSAADFPELKPDSIYFTDEEDRIPVDPTINYGGHDNGIFDYKNRTLSPCYYPCDAQSIKKIEPAPMWFTPNPL